MQAEVVNYESPCLISGLLRLITFLNPPPPQETYIHIKIHQRMKKKNLKKVKQNANGNVDAGTIPNTW